MKGAYGGDSSVKPWLQPAAKCHQRRPCPRTVTAQAASFPCTSWRCWAGVLRTTGGTSSHVRADLGNGSLAASGPAVPGGQRWWQGERPTLPDGVAVPTALPPPGDLLPAEPAAGTGAACACAQARSSLPSHRLLEGLTLRLLHLTSG